MTTASRRMINRYMQPTLKLDLLLYTAEAAIDHLREVEMQRDALVSERNNRKILIDQLCSQRDALVAVMQRLLQNDELETEAAHNAVKAALAKAKGE